ncbi:nuclear transport factor 2 family protein [Streptomyces sp. ISL-44]|uniref:nuclear transport factor 2 family protein n=1 Tax=Streptomyces sp. ISL-44 TaxID=2819184 RepID=UPI001BE9D201|nr:nuclear transport factor 2 family protein [Streptomyces sp. ISL-44]MBT2545092.1 nuclear transport factor 2 family protein [Streptomyces sp. ISL-44]
MTLTPGKLSDPVVGAFVAAVNGHDKDAFLALLTPDATMSDDGSDRDLHQWIDKEIFDSGGHMQVESESDGGHHLVVNYRNDTWGEMRTAWKFHVTPGGRISRFETGQA